MEDDASHRGPPPAAGVHARAGRSGVTPQQRMRLLGQRPLTVWLTGLSGSGKSTLARRLEARLVDMGRAAYVLDGDNLRQGLCRDLSFSPADRHENIRRAAAVARLLNDAGLIAIAAFITPYREDRKRAREVVGADRFVEVYLSADVATCERRDPKGLYARARAGELADFSGVSAPYEPPTDPTLALDTARRDEDACVAELLRVVEARIAPG